MRQHTINLYTFAELDERAKDRARDAYRMHALDYDWWDCVYKDAEYVGLKITGFDLGRAQRITGELIGTVRDTVQSILSEHGKNCDTYKLAQEYYRRRHIGNPMDEEEFTQQLLKEYWIMLQNEYEYLLSDEAINELMEVYEFTENGDIH